MCSSFDRFGMLKMGPQCGQVFSAGWTLEIDSFHADIVMPEKFLVINGVVGS